MASVTPVHGCVNCQQDEYESLARRPLNMNMECDRLATFDMWTYGEIQNPRELAKCGLFYIGPEDRVKCAFCFGVLKKWERTDVPYHEHKTHFPQCRFIRGYEVGNIPIKTTSVNYLYSSHSNGIRPNTHYNEMYPSVQHNSTLLNMASPTPKNIKLTVGLNDPRENGTNDNFQDFYRSEDNRRMSFSGWPLDLPQTPEILAAAGFYHNPTDGKQDRVKCAYCSGKLYNWKSDDDPWIEHARCFPECPYVELCMGKDVLRDLLNQPRPTQNGIPEHRHVNGSLPVPTLTSPTPTSISSTPTTPENGTTEESFSALMTSAPVQAVLEMGFSEEMVKQTVERCLRDRPGNFPPAEELASIVMELEDQQPAAAVEPAPVQSPLQRLMAARRPGNDVKREGNPSQTSSSSGQDLGASSVRNEKQRQDSSPTVNKDKIKSENSRLKDQLLCKICMENYVRVTFMPCGHLVCCGPCSMAVSSCPICRASITDYVRTYF